MIGKSAYEADKFIAPNSTQHIARAQRTCQALGNHSYHFVASVFAMFLDDLTESVEVEVQHCQRAQFRLRVSEHLLEMHVEARAIQ